MSAPISSQTSSIHHRRAVRSTARLSILRCVAGLLLATAFGGCMPDSKQPLAPLSAALPEPRLVGAWSGKIQEEEVYLKIRQRDGNLFDIAVFGRHWLEYYSAYVTDIGGPRFANLQRLSLNDCAYIPNYYFANYRFEGPNRLVVRFIAEKAAIDAVKAGRLEGDVSNFEEQQIINLDDEPARLVKFLNSTDAATLFDKPLTFTRTPTP